MKRFISLFIVFILTFNIISCTNTKVDNGDESSEEEITLADINFSEYSVIRSDLSQNKTTLAAVKLRKYLSEAIGTELKIGTDFVKKTEDIPLDAKEILVGETNRAESQNAFEKLEDFDFMIKLESEKILIIGGSDSSTSAAVDYFIVNYINGNKVNIPEDLEYMFKYTPIDNSNLIPAYVSDDKVTLEACETGGDEMTPDWAKTLIMMEIHLATATPEGTFASAVKVLDHCAQMGVNGIWLTPIYEQGPGGNGYGNIGPHSVEPALTGTGDYEEGWKVVKDFVDEAHKRGIRVILDIITWGTVTAAPLFSEHPEWYKGEAWGNQAFNWKVEEFREWFISTCVDNILKTGADGYRCDCEPNYTGYSIFNQIRERCLEAGRKILVIAEDGCKREDCFDFEQDGVLNYIGWTRGEQYQTPKRFYIDEFNIVDSVKNGLAIGENSLQQRKRGGQYRFYTYCVSNHDFQYSIVNRNRLTIGYQAIMAPFIPLWYFGEEFNLQAERQVFYFVPVDWSLLDDYDNLMFLEDIKKYIQIRRTYPEIFEYYPFDHRESNICAVNTENGNLQAYARYSGNKMIIVVPNNSKNILSVKIDIPFEEAGFEKTSSYKLTNLMNGSEIKGENNSFSANIEAEHMGIYLIEII